MDGWNDRTNENKYIDCVCVCVDYNQNKETKAGGDPPPERRLASPT